MWKRTGMVLALSLAVCLSAVSSSPAAVAFVDGWPAFFQGTTLLSDDRAIAVASAELRNVYVTGASPSADTGVDIVTIKYKEGYTLGCTTPLCLPEWTVRYDAGHNGADVPVAIAIDGAGDVIVCGYSLGDAGNFDIVLIKYDGTTGDRIWVKRYDGPYNRADYPTAMVLDGEFIYVTGRTTNFNGNDNLIVIKYNDDGPVEPSTSPVWARDYNAGKGSNDVGTCIAVTKDGIVYVGAMILGKFATLRYSANGARDWVKLTPSRTRNNNQARSIGVNAKGEAFVTGDSDGMFVTIKYNMNGRSLWKRVYRGRTRNPDVARLLVVDPVGDVYVSGESDHGITTIKYTGLRGGARWIQRYSLGDHAVPTGMVLDAAGDAYVVGSVRTPTDESDLLTYKLDGFNGHVLWSDSYNRETGSTDEGAAITLDAANNVCVTGVSCSGGLCDYTTIKYEQQ
ncbi:MAG: hypothetical protein AB9873_05630 [Syntrophobacteraceae bacterium]